MHGAASDTAWHLAQVNIARLVAAYPDPRVVPFFDALERINALADTAPGFVWRLQDGDGNATGLQTAPDPLLVINLSVWREDESLYAFIYGGEHATMLGRRRDYFDRLDGAYQALWWIPAGTLPTVAEAFAKLALLDAHGPSADAFTFKARFPQPGQGMRRIDPQPDPPSLAGL